MEKIQQVIIKVMLFFAILSTISCQQKTDSITDDCSDLQQYRQERNDLREEIEAVYDVTTPASPKKVQKTFWGIPFGEKANNVIYRLKEKGFNSSYIRYKDSAPVVAIGECPNCTNIYLGNGCQFANHSFFSATLYFTPAPKERFFAIKFWHAENPRQLFQDILNNYPIKKVLLSSQKSDVQRDVVLDTIFDYQGPRKIIRSIKKRFPTGQCSVKNYSYVNGRELWISSECSELVYIDRNILKEDVGKESDL